MTPRATPLPPDQRRAAIITAARPLLLEHGGHFTTKQVAEAAGIAEGTLFRVFPTKRDLMHAVIANAMDPAELCATLDGIDRSTPLDERTTTVIDALQQSIRDVSAIFGALFTMPTEDVNQLKAKSTHHGDPELKAEHERQARELHEALVRVFTADADSLACTPDEAASLIRSLAFATSHPHFSDHRLEDPAHIARLVLGGIAPTTTREETSC